MTVLITEAINTIIIVGAGLAGLSLSLGLANAGYSVALIERQVDFSRTGATLGVQRNGKKALDELYDGITEDLREAGLEIPEVGGTMVAWWNCRDALLKRVEANPSIELHLGCNTKTIVDGNDCVRVTIEKRIAERTEENKGSTSSDSDKTLTLEGLALIGADGVNSCVRDHLKLSKAQWAEILTWRTRLSVSENDNSEEAELLRPFLNIPVAPMGTRLRGPMNYALFNFHDKLPGTMAFTANLNCANIQESVDDVTSPQAFLERFAESPEELQEINAILQFCEKDGLNYAVKLKVVNLPKDDKNGWGGKGRITLIGDAAHGMRPVSGQGGSMAFEDSAVLCRYLRKIRGTNPTKAAIETLLKDFEKERLPRVRRIWDDQWDRAEKVYKNIQAEPWSKEFSDWVFNGV